MSSFLVNNLPQLLLPFVPFTVATVFWLWNPFAGIVSRETWYKEYDYVIVGGGSAGSVLASRLSEDPNITVLLLEAGPFENLITDTPYLAPALQNTPIDWKYRTEPQANACLGMKGRVCNWPRGKVLGGCSTINYMVYARGNRRDYDGWVKLGAQGWSFNEVFPYFIKSENMKDPILRQSPWHGKSGPLQVQHPNFVSQIGPMFVEAGKYLGYKEVDYNGAQQTGFAIAQNTLQNGARGSSAKSYLKPIMMSRRNLHVLIDTFATRIVFNNQRKAHGVYFDRFDVKNQRVKARREVILSAGAINSPQLLMLSGVGPAADLRALNIPVVADLPGVGMNLQDQIAPLMSFFINQSLDIPVKTGLTLTALEQFYLERKGPLASPGGLEAFGFIKTKYADPNDDYPDFQIHFAATSALGDQGTIIRKIFGYTDEQWARLKPFDGRSAYTFFPLMLRQKSRGFLKLKTRNPYDHPLIDPQYYTHPDDMKMTVDAMKISLQLVATPVLQRIGSSYFGLHLTYPSCDAFKDQPLSDEALACVARATTATIYHPTGTCKMGSPMDSMAVVGPDLKVFKVDGLRVIDASVMPTVPSGNTNAPMIMMAEKASDMIKAENR